jgi:hypothetical protein
MFSFNPFLQELSCPNFVFRVNVSMITVNSVNVKFPISALSDNRDFVYSITQKKIKIGRIWEASVNAKCVVRSLESAQVFHQCLLQCALLHNTLLLLKSSPILDLVLSFLKQSKKHLKYLLVASEFPVNCNLIQPCSNSVTHSCLNIHNLRSLYCRLRCPFS